MDRRGQVCEMIHGPLGVCSQRVYTLIRQKSSNLYMYFRNVTQRIQDICTEQKDYKGTSKYEDRYIVTADTVTPPTHLQESGGTRPHYHQRGRKRNKAHRP